MKISYLKLFFACSLIVKLICSTCMALAVLLYWAYCIQNYGIAAQYWILGIILIPAILVSIYLLMDLRKGQIRKWLSSIFFVESFFTIFVAMVYFEEPMHDIALDFFGYHGRFVVSGLNKSPYLLNSDTLPFVLFLPPLILGAAFFATNRIGKLSKR
ncbi:MAG: hypothetical protein JW902_09895 [Syntrophaceae bacterium]|nr:hypothetical protein [Syntrophaceae bacterium]